MPSSIVCYGDVIDDIVVAPAGPIRVDTDTPSIIHMRPGGSAANTAAWLGWLGAPVTFVGVAGRGDAKRHARLLPGVNGQLREHSSLQTGRIVIVVQDERRDMLTDRGANVDLGPDDVTDAMLRQAQLLHLTGYALLNRTGIAGFRTLIERCRAAKVLVSISPGSAGFIADIGVERVVRAFAGADLLLAGLEEGLLLANEKDPETAVTRLNVLHEIVVMTMGSRGLIVGERGAVSTIAVDPRPVVDPTGAGDAFCAGFLNSWLADGDVQNAAVAGAEVAAEAVGIMGGRPPYSPLSLE